MVFWLWAEFLVVFVAMCAERQAKAPSNWGKTSLATVWWQQFFSDLDLLVVVFWLWAEFLGGFVAMCAERQVKAPSNCWQEFFGDLDLLVVVFWLWAEFFWGLRGYVCGETGKSAIKLVATILWQP